jgi:cation transport protein ChaC
MWIFGYGSLMWDGWETKRDCSCRKTAELRGFVRSFNKLSVRNWGTRDYPGPTLNLIAGEGSCRGIAFEFPENRRSDIHAYLTAREGKGFALRDLPIVVEGGLQANAIVPIYSGRNVTSATDAGEIAALALRAKGTSGSCAVYIESIAEHLRRLGIEDPAVVAIERDVHNLATRATKETGSG